MDELALACLGSFVATYDQQPLLQFRTRAAQALLVYLVCEPGPHLRETLMTLLWPELPCQSAQSSLRQNLYLLNQAIPALPVRSGNGAVPVVLASRQTVQIHPEARYRLDVRAFVELLSQDPSHWPEAVALYRGDFLADFFLPGSASFEEWARARRADLRRRCLDALSHLAGQALEAGDTASACSYAYRQLEIDNLRESGYRQLMTALALGGQRSEALVHYEACRRLLRAELGVDPAPHTQALYERIASGELGAVERGPVVARAPERPRHNLPLHLSSFIGRQAELAEVGRLLDRSRLVTLTGPGGCGKTRLALQAARQLLDNFPNGVWLVDLAPLSEPLLVTKAVAAALDVAEVAGEPLMDELLHHLRSLQLLLVLDNCEHLVAAAAELAELLLRHCPTLRILATSREALDIAGEVAWLVPPLSLPELDAELALIAIHHSDAVCLFRERAGAALPAFALTEENAGAVVHICRQLDGIPLAIELAAARVNLLRVEQIAARLDDCFHLLTGGSRTELPRHRTLAATFDWSYDLLAPAEQRLLRALAVFAGGFTLEAAEAVCACAGGEGVLELLTQLVNKSLVVGRRAPGHDARYHLLATIRQYALDKLRAAGEVGEVQSRHLAYFLQLAETAEPWLHSEGQLTWLDRLERELDNFRAALGCSLAADSEALAEGVSLLKALFSFWEVRGNRAEFRSWWRLALAERHRAPLPLRVWLLSFASVYDPPLEGYEALLEESLKLCLQSEDEPGMARSLDHLGRNALYSGDLRKAESYLSESLALARELSDKYRASEASVFLGMVAICQGDFSLAMEHATRSQDLAREVGDRSMKSVALNMIADVALAQRDYAKAIVVYQQALPLAREVGARVAEAYGLFGLGRVAFSQRDYDRAETFFRESQEAYRAAGDVASGSALLAWMGFAVLGQGDCQRAATLLQEGISLGHPLQWPNLRNVWGLARIALAEGHGRQATMLLAAVRPLFETYVIWNMPVDGDDYQADVALARNQLGEDGFAAAWAEGQALSIDEAIALALQEPHPTR
jgi:predicted ATPase/DNA-binding SARP family transcriptional activator